MHAERGHIATRADRRPTGRNLVATLLSGLLAAVLMVAAIPGTATASQTGARGSTGGIQIDWTAECSDGLMTVEGEKVTVAEVLAQDADAQRRYTRLMASDTVVAQLWSTGAESQADVEEMAGMLALSFGTDEGVQEFIASTGKHTSDMLALKTTWPWQLKCNKARAAYALYQGMGTGICGGLTVASGGLALVVCNLLKSAAGGKVNWNSVC
ncbi:hypothetical protein H3146_08755 [Streptomyces sp. OF3]|uniref:Uncharacterized protein n=1 Tax=Streptomyces alkaliterrae TaxID=2213162 RepID=A0A7W3WJP1_9ACTN|nr:hypothetical protein [Streptomyces alkaliterrae]MBB1253460.1 hypothetical protein [Streptomyces alkaliterrae]